MNMSNIIEKIKNCGFDDIKLISEGGHGQCYFVKRNGVSYILKSFFCNSRAEAAHEEKIIKELHGETKGNPYFFKAEVISATDDVFFLLNHTNAGKTLEELKEKDTDTDVLSLSDATDIIIKACDSVQELHSKGYIHFDIKPSNLYFVDKISHVLAIDFGSAVKKRQKSYEEIIESNGYWSTRGFLSKRLSDFCERLSTYRNIEVSQEEKDKLVDDEASLSIKEDIFALICTYWFMITGKEHFGIWDRDMRFLPTDKKIIAVLEQNEIPAYLTSPLAELFLTLDEPSKNAETEIPFDSIDELVKKLETIKEIMENRGLHPEVLLRNSMEYFSKNFSDIVIDEELLCDIEEIKDEEQ